MTVSELSVFALLWSGDLCKVCPASLSLHFDEGEAWKHWSIMNLTFCCRVMSVHSASYSPTKCSLIFQQAISNQLFIIIWAIHSAAVEGFLSPAQPSVFLPTGLFRPAAPEALTRWKKTAGAPHHCECSASALYVMCMSVSVRCLRYIFCNTPFCLKANSQQTEHLHY